MVMEWLKSLNIDTTNVQVQEEATGLIILFKMLASGKGLMESSRNMAAFDCREIQTTNLNRTMWEHVIVLLPVLCIVVWLVGVLRIIHRRTARSENTA